MCHDNDIIAWVIYVCTCYTLTHHTAHTITLNMETGRPSVQGGCSGSMSSSVFHNLGN
jgi:hypothetical protein